MLVFFYIFCILLFIYLAVCISVGRDAATCILDLRDVPLNRVSFHGKNHATGCPFLIKIVRQGITMDKKNYDSGYQVEGCFLEFT